MPGKLLQYPDLDLAKIVGIVGIINGGTDGDTAPEAVTNLGGVSRSTIGQANGPVPLESNGKINISFFDNNISDFVTITGPSTLFVNQVGQYFISNHDTFKTYTVATSTGSVSRVSDDITYTAPSTPGMAGFTVNGRQIDINVTVVPKTIQTPTILTPANNATDISNVPSFTSSVYVPQNGAGVHQSSDWQISEDGNFTTTADAIQSNTTHKTSWNNLETILKSNTIYYARVRYRSADGVISSWSPAISFTVFDISSYAISVVPNITTVNEGSSVTFNVTSMGIPNGTVLAFNTVVGSAPTYASANDFGDGTDNNSPKGVFTFNNNTASFVVNTFNDTTTETNEIFHTEVISKAKTRTGITNSFSDNLNIQLQTQSVSVTIVANDAPTYNITVTDYASNIITSVLESATAKFHITTTNVPNGTVLYWKVNEDDFITPLEFNPSLLSGSVTINNNTALVNLTLNDDGITEGNESFIFNLRTGSQSGPIVASSGPITIIDAGAGSYPEWLIGADFGGTYNDPIYLTNGHNINFGAGIQFASSNYPTSQPMTVTGNLPPGTAASLTESPQSPYLIGLGEYYHYAIYGIPTTPGTYTVTFQTNYLVNYPFPAPGTPNSKSFTKTFIVS